MNISQAVILGVVQGVTEFFPISSSGHLVIMQHLFGIKEPMIAFDIFLHLGTLAAILLYFRKDLIAMFTSEKRTALCVAVAMVPTVIIGLMFKDAVEELLIRPRIVGYMLIATGVMLIASNLYSAYSKGRTPKKMGLTRALIIGAFQGVAVIPGISRSGATIASGILAGIDREKAFRFSFLLAIPAILGASVLKAHDIGTGLSSGDMLLFIAGGVTAMVVGLFSIGVLLKIVKSNKLYLFGIYCFIAAALIITKL